MSPVRCQSAMVLLICAPVMIALPTIEVQGRMQDASHSDPQPAPPIAPRETHRIETHGDVLHDPYHWMQDRDHPNLMPLIEAENAYTEAMMAHTTELQEQLYEEMLARQQPSVSSLPSAHGGYLYYSRVDPGKQFGVHCRRRDVDGAPEEIILDLDELAERYGTAFVPLHRISPDHSRLAYMLDTDNDERFIIRVRDLDTGEELADEIGPTGWSFAWANDNRTLFYAAHDESGRNSRIYRYTIGGDQPQPVLIHEESESSFGVGVLPVRSGRFVQLLYGSWTTGEVHLIDADDPFSEPICVSPRRDGVDYRIEHVGEWIYLLTNADSVDKKLVRIRLDQLDQQIFEEVAVSDERYALMEMQGFEHHLALFQRDDGRASVRILQLDGSPSLTLDFPDQAFRLYKDDNPVFGSNQLRVAYASPRTPATTLAFDMNTGERRVLQQQEVAGEYDPEDYIVKRRFATADDGTRIPISIIHRKDVELNGRNPTLLHGYGFFGLVQDPSFDDTLLPLLDRGFVCVWTHLRGGGEYGLRWQEAGKFFSKNNTFTDFLTCAEYLIDHGYTEPRRLAIRGRSAGGILVGVAVNRRPDLFAAAIAHVPNADQLVTSLDRTLPLTDVYRGEYGNPDEERMYWFLKGYMPIQNVSSQEYPHLLMTCGFNDPRVFYWEAMKWAATLRAVKTDDRPVLLKIDIGGGHGGTFGRFNRLRERAFEFAFLFDRLGLE